MGKENLYELGKEDAKTSVQNAKFTYKIYLSRFDIEN